MKKELTLLEAVRKRPGMFIGSMSDQAFIEMVKNLLTSVISQYEANEVEVDFFNTNSVQLVFSGIKKEIPLNHSCEYKDSLNNLGLDIPVLNFLSQDFSFVLLGENNEIKSIQKFKRGTIQSGVISSLLVKCNKLKLIAKLDGEIWEDRLKWNYYHFQKELNEFAYLNKNVKIRLKYNIEGEGCNIIYKHRNGMYDWLEIIKLSGYGNSYFQTYIEEETDEFYLEIAFAFRELSIDEAIIKSFVNDRYTHERGSHVDGLLKGVTYGVMKYFQKYGLVDSYKISERGMEQSLVALISVKMKNAIYSGCVKNKLANPEIIKPISKIVSDMLFAKIDGEKQTTERLIRRFEV